MRWRIASRMRCRNLWVRSKMRRALSRLLPAHEETHDPLYADKALARPVARRGSTSRPCRSYDSTRDAHRIAVFEIWRRR
jgi:hypothetical protein